MSNPKCCGEEVCDENGYVKKTVGPTEAEGSDFKWNEEVFGLHGKVQNREEEKGELRAGEEESRCGQNLDRHDRKEKPNE